MAGRTTRSEIRRLFKSVGGITDGKIETGPKGALTRRLNPPP